MGWRDGGGGDAKCTSPGDACAQVQEYKGRKKKAVRRGLVVSAAVSNTTSAAAAAEIKRDARPDFSALDRSRSARAAESGEGQRCNRSRTSRTRERRELRKGEADWRLTGGCLSRRQIVKTKPESQWIVITRPLYHLQQPVSYSSRLQVIHSSGYGNCDGYSSCNTCAMASPEL